MGFGKRLRQPGQGISPHSVFPTKGKWDEKQEGRKEGYGKNCEGICAFILLSDPFYASPKGLELKEKNFLQRCPLFALNQ